MLTTTIQESDRLIQQATKASYSAAHKRVKLRKVGRDSVDGDRLAELTMLVWAMNSWQQGKYTHEEYTNMFNNAELQKAFAQIKKLANGL